MQWNVLFRSSTNGFVLSFLNVDHYYVLDSVPRLIKSVTDLCCTLGSHVCLFFFQACTGIDNIAEAITLLELNNWDLVVSFTHTNCNTLGYDAAVMASIISARQMFPTKRMYDHRPWGIGSQADEPKYSAVFMRNWVSFAKSCLLIQNLDILLQFC